MKEKKKSVAFWALVILIGGLAGILADNFVLPGLANVPPFDKIGWLAQRRDGTTVINQNQQLTISQDEVWQEAILRLINSMVAVNAFDLKSSAKPRLLTEGSGFFVTGDGLIVTAGNVAAKNAGQIKIFRDGKSYDAEVLKRDEANNLALLKITENNLPAVTFIDLNSLRLGQMVFLLGANVSQNQTQNFTNLGFIKKITPDLTVNFSENSTAAGGPLANIKGEVIGLNLVDERGQIKVVSIDKIRDLLK